MQFPTISLAAEADAAIAEMRSRIERGIRDGLRARGVYDIAEERILAVVERQTAAAVRELHAATVAA